MKDLEDAKNYKLAVGSSLVSKVMTVVMQLSLMPLAAVALGIDGFSLFVTLSAAAGWLSVFSLGLGPVTTVRVAENKVVGTSSYEQVLVSSAFWTSVVASIVIASVASGIVFVVPVDLLFGLQFVGQSSEIEFGFLLLSVLFVLQLNISVIEAAQAGLHRQYTTNFSIAFGTALTVPLVSLVALYAPKPIFLLAASVIPTIIVRCFHVVWLMSKRSTLAPRLNLVDRRVVGLLLSSGAVYSLAGSAANFLSYSLPTIQVSRELGPDGTAAFASMMHLITLLSGVTSMLISPAVPLIASKMAEGEAVWVQRAYSRLVISCLGVATLAAASLAVAGDKIFDFWLRGTVLPGFPLAAWAGVYFVLATWEQVHFSLLVAVHKAEIASIIVFCRAFIGAFLSHYMVTFGDVWSPFLAMSVAIALISALPIWLLYRVEVARRVRHSTSPF